MHKCRLHMPKCGCSSRASLGPGLCQGVDRFSGGVSSAQGVYRRIFVRLLAGTGEIEDGMRERRPCWGDGANGAKRGELI